MKPSLIYSNEGNLILEQDIAADDQDYSVVYMLEDINGDEKLDIGVAYARGVNYYGEGVIRIYDGHGVLLKELVKEV